MIFREIAIQVFCFLHIYHSHSYTVIPTYLPGLPRVRMCLLYSDETYGSCVRFAYSFTIIRDREIETNTSYYFSFIFENVFIFFCDAQPSLFVRYFHVQVNIHMLHALRDHLLLHRSNRLPFLAGVLFLLLKHN